jgi:hypothetical protein
MRIEDGMNKNVKDEAQKIIKKNIDNGLLIEPYSHLWLMPRVDLLFDKKLSSGKDLKKNSSNYLIASLQNKKFNEELCSLYLPLSSYFDDCDYKYFKHDLLNFLLINLQTKQLLVIRVDQEYNLIEVDIDFDYSLKEIMDMDKLKSSKPKLPNYKKFLNCDYLGLINQFITLIAMISNLLSKLKQVNLKSASNDDPTPNELRQNIDDIITVLPALNETALEDISSKLKELNDIARLFIASRMIIIDRGSVEKQVDTLCRNDTPSTLLLSLRDKLQIFFPKISYEI